MTKNLKHTEGKVKSNGAQTRSWPLISQSIDDAQTTRGPLGQVTSEHVIDKELLTWPARQRQLYKDGRLPDAYAKILEAVPGWSWEQNPKIENRSHRGGRINLAKFDSAEVLRLMDPPKAKLGPDRRNGVAVQHLNRASENDRFLDLDMVGIELLETRGLGAQLLRFFQP